MAATLTAAPPDTHRGLKSQRGRGARAARHIYAAAAGLAVALMCIRIVSGYATFTETYDEPFHIACGMEWLDKHVYHYEAQHPPLSRVAAAIGPYLAGERAHGLADPLAEGNKILGEGPRYTRNLTAARLGELPFVLLACAAVWCWTRRLFGYRAAFIAVLLFSMLPPVLAHGGLATTDISIAATCTWALYAYFRFLEDPTLKHSLLVGLWTGLAAISKFSSIPFLGAGFVVLLVVYITCTRRWRTLRIGSAARYLKLAAPGLTVTCLIVWACFRFTFAPLFPPEELARRTADFSPALTRPGLIHTVVTTIPVPAGQYFRGIGQVWRHNKGGQWSYLLGQRRDSGWWYYFPVVLGLKTPLGFLLLSLAGAALLLWRLGKHADWKRAAPVVCAIVILLSCLPSRINIGVRHILPIYPLLAIAAAFAVSEALARGRRAAAVLALAGVGWCCASSLLAHPDYLAYFNEIASPHPERFLLDSDLDWGQDLGRLSKRLNELRVPAVSLEYFGTADLTRFNLPPSSEISCDGRWNGYVAASATMLYLAKPLRSKCPEHFAELARMEPRERVGRSFFLYYFEPPR